MKLHHKLILHAIIGHLVLSVILFFGLYFVINRYFENALLQRSKSEVQSIFEVLYQGMLKGYNKEELDKIVESFNRENVKVALEVSEKNHKEIPSQELISKRKGEIIYKYFITAKEECLKCHQVQKGQILGTLEIRKFFF
ncbi:MAG: hypothetical protein ACK40E_05420, partial [Caldimicrobium sp.]